MTTALTGPDATLPAGRPVQTILARLLARQASEVMAKARAGQPPPRLDNWTRPMVEAFLPPITNYVHRAGHDTMRRLVRLLAARENRRSITNGHVHRVGSRGDGAREAAVGRRGGRAHPANDRRDQAAGQYPGLHRAIGYDSPGLRADASHLQGDRLTWLAKRTSFSIPPRLLFQATHPNVLEAIGRLVFDFCRATNETSAMQLGEALAKLRQELAEGLSQGETLDRLADRVGKIFLDPMRAARIAQTESSRAIHLGQYLAAKQSEVVKGKKWIAAPERVGPHHCEDCDNLNGVIVGLDEDFAFVSGRGIYSRIPFPPFHPFCRCSVEDVLIDPRDLKFLPAERRAILALAKMLEVYG